MFTFLVFRYIFSIFRSSSLYQGHWVKVKITGAKKCLCVLFVGEHPIHEYCTDET